MNKVCWEFYDEKFCLQKVLVHQLWHVLQESCSLQVFQGTCTFSLMSCEQETCVHVCATPPPGHTGDYRLLSLHSCLLITLPFPLKMWSDFVIMLLRTQHLQWNPFQFISASRLKSKQLPLPFSTSVLKTGESLDEEIHLPTLYRHAPVLCSGRSTGSTQTMGLNFWWAQLRIL